MRAGISLAGAVAMLAAVEARNQPRASVPGSVRRGRPAHGVHIASGEPALLQPGRNTGEVRAQFDSLRLPEWLTHGWTRFKRNEFRIDRRDA